jgi:hypothetical protein
LYKSLGWKEVGKLDVDLRDWVYGGGDGKGWGTYRITCGVRLPDVWKNNDGEECGQ